MAKKTAKKDPASQAPREEMERLFNEQGRQSPLVKQEPETMVCPAEAVKGLEHYYTEARTPEKPVELRVEEEIEKLYGDIPRGATELYLRAILRELVRARIS